MGKETRCILGDIVMVPDNVSVGFSLVLQSEGTIHQNYGREYYYLSVTFLAGDGLKIENSLLLARGTDGYGENADPYRNNLFLHLHAGKFSEKIHTELSKFLLEKYQAGEIKEEDIVQKLESLLRESKGGNACRFCNRRY